jgi:cell division protein FtsZ
MAMNLQAPDITGTEAPDHRVRRRRRRRQCRQQHDRPPGSTASISSVANTDAQALTCRSADRHHPDGPAGHRGPRRRFAAGSRACGRRRGDRRDPRPSAGAHMCFVTAGMGGGTGTGAAPVVARAPATWASSPSASSPSRSSSRASAACAWPRPASANCNEAVDTLIVIPNQNLFRVANEKTTFADAFAMADQVLYSGVACITDLMVKEGLINLDFADVRAVMREMGKAMMGTGEASGEKRALMAGPKRRSPTRCSTSLDEGRAGLLISITGGRDMTLYRSRRGRHPHPRGSRLRTPTSSSAPPSTRRWKARSASRSSRPASTSR